MPKLQARYRNAMEEKNIKQCNVRAQRKGYPVVSNRG